MKLSCPPAGLATALLWSVAASPMAFGADPYASPSTTGDPVAQEEASLEHRSITDFNVVLLSIRSRIESKWCRSRSWRATPGRWAAA